MMHRTLIRTVVALALPALCLTGCTQKPQAAERTTTPYVNLPEKEVPDFLKGTIWQYVDLANTGPQLVSGYGLVVGLDGTGDTRAPNVVREYMIKQMQKHGFGNSNIPGMEKFTPEQVLNDPAKRVAIVRVEAFIPPGARKGQLIDVQVTALENSNTSSLHRGMLYQTDLALRGTDPANLGGGVVNPIARASGPIMVNPAIATQDEDPNAAERLALRTGIVMGRGIVVDDRPLSLRIRQAASAQARATERRIQDSFQDTKAASAKSPQEVWVNVPEKYGTDWEHFAGVVTHLYYNASTEFATIQAAKLAEIAKRDKEQAPLMDISYCWEGLGAPALPKIQPLLNHESPEVSFAAARAAAHLGDVSAQDVLAQMARTPEHPFQIVAVRTLGQLKPPTPRVRQILRELLNGDQRLVRIEAYEAMIASQDPIVVTRSVRERFLIDLVHSDGPPIIYATRVGTPRLAFIGRRAVLASDAWYLGLKRRLSITVDSEQGAAKLFYRGNENEEQVEIPCALEAGVVAARLGGDGPTRRERMNLSYTDVVGVFERLCSKQLIVASGSQAREPATFVMQALPGTDDPILTAPTIPEQRPTSDRPAVDTAPRIDAAPSPASGPAPTDPSPIEQGPPPSPFAPSAPSEQRPAR